MSYYNKIKKIDEESLQKLTEGKGPSDECLCSLLYNAEDNVKRGIGTSIKKAFASFAQNKNKKEVFGQQSVDIPLTFTKGGKGVYTTKESVKHKGSCNKCSCDNQNFVLKHSYANIRISTPDISSICPCPTDCLPDKEKLLNNIKVTVERLGIPESSYPDLNVERKAFSDTTIIKSTSSNETDGSGNEIKKSDVNKTLD